jgi:RecJ-like exonuclease
MKTKIYCPDCAGTGIVQTASSICNCQTCAGHGYVDVVSSTYGPCSIEAFSRVAEAAYKIAERTGEIVEFSYQGVQMDTSTTWSYEKMYYAFAESAN